MLRPLICLDCLRSVMPFVPIFIELFNLSKYIIIVFTYYGCCESICLVAQTKNLSPSMSLSQFTKKLFPKGIKP